MVVNNFSYTHFPWWYELV